MPGSIAETVYGRRGGGWASKERAEPVAPKKESDPECRTCKTAGRTLRYSGHSGETCRSCFSPVEHCAGARSDECWAGRARMARAKQAAGGTLNDVELESLIRAGIDPAVTP